jgi:hypothetical protein
MMSSVRALMPSRRAVALLSVVLATVTLVGCFAPPSPVPTPLPTPGIRNPTSVPKPSPSPSPSPSPAAVNPVTTGSEIVAAPANSSVKITSPAANASVPRGSVKVTYDVNNAPTVAAASATKVEDLHLHVLLDIDAAPYVGTTTFIPLGNPAIVHTAGKEVTFENVAPGQHKVTVILTGANHISVRPPVTDTITFTVQ